MNTYEDLIQKYQEGKLSDLQFLLAQTDLAKEYLADIREKEDIPTCKNAREWILEYENRNLYESEEELWKL